METLPKPIRSFPVMRSRVALVVACVAFPVLFRLLLAIWVVHPSPAVEDEFSYLLAADTFALGRLTNPPHPMWKHFETFHVLQQPTYASKYPPGQGMILAVGQVLFGDPLIGVWLSAGFMCGAICWMLQAWLPPNWVLVGVLLAIIEYVIGFYWMESYWGGCLAAAGGALVVGAIPRLLRHRRRFTAALMLGFGLAILAMTRPYEGGLLAISAGGVGLWQIAKNKRATSLRALGISLVPTAIVLVVTAGFLMLYNWRITGHASEFPYMLYEHRYRSGQLLFRWQQKVSVAPAFNNPAMQRLYDFEHRLIAKSLTWHGTAGQIVQILNLRWFWMVWRLNVFVAVAPLVMMPWLIRQRKMLLPLICFGVLVVGLSLSTIYQEHYAAPITAVKILLAVESLRRLTVALWTPFRRFRLLPLLRLRQLSLIMSGVLLLVIVRHSLNFSFPPDQKLRGISVERPRILSELNRLPGKHLVLVRYEPAHDPRVEWVYNAANIDQSKIVWARDLDAASNAELLRYFHDRRIWLLQPDDVLPRLQPSRAPVIR